MTAVELLEEMKKLMNLKGENPFKVRAFEKAAISLEGVTDLEARAKAGTLTELPGIGKGISEVLTDFFVKKSTAALDELKKSLPPGLVELTEIPGLGPKKAMTLIEELGIQSVGELEQACRENRLLKIKGFGEKVQHKVLEGIQFQKSHQGQLKLSDVFPLAELFMKELTTVVGGARVSETGELRRRLEILSSMDFLIEASADNEKKLKSKIEAAIKKFQTENSIELPIQVNYAYPQHFGYELAKSSSSKAHWEAIGKPEVSDSPDEEGFYKGLNLPWIAPELRETGDEVALARAGKLDQVLPWDGIQGVFHNHTTRSDGTASLEEMVVAAKNLGYKYIGISDHSQSAFYASGLKTDSLLEQECEVRELQDKYPEIRIFWGIESDILADGSLDYPDSFLKKFDFVVASVHSRFQMDKEAMTDRLLYAIRNPYTRFLGHATGRILLGRKGYELHMEKIIAEAAAHDVAIELNASPSRLDIDWRWGGELRKSRTKISINPDAHATSELEDTRYGIAMARKSLVPISQIVNTQNAAKVEQWLKRR
jgi:DNA polymerase (family 10)